MSQIHRKPRLKQGRNTCDESVLQSVSVLGLNTFHNYQAHSACEPESSLVTTGMTSPRRVMLIHTQSSAIVSLYKSLNLPKCQQVQCAKWLSPSH